MTVRVVPDPQQQCLIGWVVLGLTWCAAGAGAFVVGSWLSKRWLG